MERLSCVLTSRASVDELRRDKSMQTAQWFLDPGEGAVFLVQDQIGEDGPYHELPEASLWHVERRHRIVADLADVQRTRNVARAIRQGTKIEPQPPGERQQQRPDQVKLLFDPQRPEMKKRLGACSVVEVAAFVAENEIWNKSGSAGMLCELPEFVGKQCIPSEPIAGKQHQCQCGKYPPDAACVEIQKAETVAFEVFENDC